MSSRLDRPRSRAARASGSVRPRPILLFIVYGVFLVIVGVTATAQVVIASTHFSTATLNHTVGTDATVVAGYVNERLLPTDLAGGPISAGHATELREGIGEFISRRGILHAEVRTPDGTIIASEAGALGVRGVASDSDWDTALRGEIGVSILDAGPSASGIDLGTPSVLREIFPLRRDGRVVGTVAIWRDAAPIIKAQGEVRRDIVLVTITAAFAAALVLFLVFRSAQARISRQTVALIESTRRDPLTGSLNHGALVEAIATMIEQHREAGGGVGIALLDIDNFRALNDTWGHEAGDAAILRVAELLDRFEPALIGRYGPDEFLIAVERLAIGTLVEELESLRSALADTHLVFGDSERLPLTVSVAVSTYPEHGSSVTEVLANTALTIREAKASGGDRVLMTGRDTDDSGEARTFDVFQGLILSVDAKDRYTKRHSEDVARYATFLAQQIGLPEDELRTIRLAGLLHDVGKIGIPDYILRKPGKLTEEEFAVVQQHVALGDSIVRDLPGLDAIRAGIRHHHERWDGNGYLHRLAQDDIPQIARILSVADTFSAMTTSRPYRKALDIREALRRLEDAAGTQLDEGLVGPFVHGIETAPDAPLPGEASPSRTWLIGPARADSTRVA
ncbi:MAG: diguanylate cyclase [Chloroflexi bacterium]|nr:diguanylate cyclase [Chloroflexota bacterium]